MSRLLIASILLLLTALASAQPIRVPELLESVDSALTERLMEYNRVFLQRELYFASRSRIVRADAELLLQDGDFNVTPFDDVAPIRIHQLRVQRESDSIYWWGEIVTGIDPYPDMPDLKLLTMITAHTWDIDASGNAEISIENRFRHSPFWAVDQLDRVILDVPPGVDPGIVGPPPETQADIDHQKRLRSLNRHAFSSVSAIFELPFGVKYVLVPLQYSPRYSVIYEVDSTRILPVSDSFEGQQNTSQYDIERIAQYRAFKNSLQDERNKAVRGDLP